MELMLREPGSADVWELCCGGPFPVLNMATIVQGERKRAREGKARRRASANCTAAESSEVPRRQI